MITKKRNIGFGVLCGLVAAVATGTSALGVPGDNLTTFDATVTAGIPLCTSGVGTGIAYDGTNLILSCWGSNVLERVNASTHGNGGAVTIAGVSDLGALAWDCGRNRLWACQGRNTVVLIDMTTGAVDATQNPINTAGCVDGLAYDRSDDTLWSSDDVSSSTEHYAINNSGGTLINSHSNSGHIGACGNSGIAVGGPSLYLANNGCSEIYTVAKDFSSSSLLASFLPFRLEDLECDDTTFGSVDAIWSQDAYDRILTAWEIPSGTCVSCGGAPPTAAAGRPSTVKKGSLLTFPKVELRWDAAGALTQDTILTLVNDFTRDVHVKLYFINGDAPTEAVYADALQTILVERAHNGWNNVDCVIELTENESTYLVMSSGVGGCQRFTILDPGAPPGRPNLEPDGGRVLRGFVIAFAVDEDQNEISYNHLSGHADLIHYGLRSAWEYQSYAFQAVNPSTGTWTDNYPGQINLDGIEYDYAFNTLLFDFFAVGSAALSNGGVLVMLDTDLTLHPVSVDLRQDSCGPITTKAHFDIWNANEDFRSGTARCITCWDQTLLSAYSVGNGLDNNFILADLGTDKGKARIDGMESFECDNLFVPPDLDDAILQWLLLHDRTCEVTVAGKEPEPEEDCCRYTINDSQDASLLGVAAKIFSFSGGATGRTWAGMNLVGAGIEPAQILFDIPAPPETATDNDGRPSGKDASQRNSLGNRNK